MQTARPEPQPVPVRLPPHCPSCGSLIHLAVLVPHERQPNLDDPLLSNAPCGEQVRDTAERVD